MAIDMTPEQKELGKANFERVVGQYADPKSNVTRRDFMKGLFAAGAVVPIGAAAYFGYESSVTKPVKAGLIGSGDEGGVLVGYHNPKYLEFVAVADIRPTQQNRIFTGDAKPTSPRKGFFKLYGSDARKNIKVHSDYKKLLEDPEIEMVVIALPLHLHAPVAIEAMQAGKHVLCEKLMAWNITQCKEMIKVAKETDRLLAIGHQRHYSMLYAYAGEVINSGVMGDIRHIRALWHRNNALQKYDKDGKPMVDDKGQPILSDSWRKSVPDDDRKALADKIRQHGYKSMEELIRWRLYNRTGGGLMAELGSHQLDACSIFLGKVHPIAVSGYGGKIFYKDDREVDDHVFATIEFPGKNYDSDKNDQVVVTYSSINTNRHEGYGECVYGTEAMLLAHKEQNVYLYGEPQPRHKNKGAPRSTSVAVTSSGGRPVLDSDPSLSDAAAPQLGLGQKALSGAVSKGYREEMEDFAYCVRMWDQAGSKEGRRLPRCHGEVAMADAIMALTSNLAMHRGQRIEFKPEWFDPESPEVPDPEMKVEIIS